jgi:thiamine biosynthesis lipoprotein
MKWILKFAFVILISYPCTAQKPYHQTLKLMGSRFDVTVIAKDSVQANQFIKQAVNEILRIERAMGISILTDGAFDISYAGMDQIWRFDGSMTSMPADEAIKASVAKVGYKNIVLNKENSTVFLKLNGMKIGFGAIGKGYAADKAKSLLIEKGVSSGIINASGDINTWGYQPNGKEWTVAIVNPLNKSNVFATLPISNGAVVTSGNYEKYVRFNNKLYTHIIDPRTGYPASGIISVSVFAPMAEIADALATSVFVMGKNVGLNRINQLPKIECVIIDDQGDIFTSNNIEIDKL